MEFSKKTTVILFSTLFFGVLLGIIGVNVVTDNKTSDQPSQEKAENYPLLAKRLFVENPNDTKINFTPLRSSFNEYFQKNNISGTLYFEYLPTGTSIRINGEKRYKGASLLKVPVAMELYKAHELGLVNLSDKVSLKKEWLDDEFGQLYTKGVGYEITLEEASRLMLVDSDNTALQAIGTTLKQAMNNGAPRAFDSLDIEISLEDDQSIQISPRAYSSFLKCLYYACYNTKQDSELILDQLSKTRFDQRLAAGVADKSIPVAHKIGVFGDNVQSDCGIVYLESNNYTLCVMIEGDDSAKSSQIIAEISKLAYEYISSNESKKI